MTTAVTTAAVDTLPLEADVLTSFWNRCGAGGDRLELLRELATVIVRTAPDWSPQATRDAKVPQPYPATGCFTCYRRDRRHQWHHIVRVACGGSNSPWNLVALCHVCHRRIHPWMEPEKDNGRRPGFVTVGEIVTKLLTPGTFVVQRPRQQVHDDEGHGPSGYGEDDE